MFIFIYYIFAIYHILYTIYHVPCYNTGSLYVVFRAPI